MREQHSPAVLPTEMVPKDIPEPETVKKIEIKLKSVSKNISMTKFKQINMPYLGIVDKTLQRKNGERHERNSFRYSG